MSSATDDGVSQRWDTAASNAAVYACATCGAILDGDPGRGPDRRRRPADLRRVRAQPQLRRGPPADGRGGRRIDGSVRPSSLTSATRFTPPGYGCGSPLLSRAKLRRNGPADTRPIRPSARMQSSASVRGDRPPSTVAMITGQASRVDRNRARILFDGISRSWYPIALSMRISVFSPGARAYRPTSALLQSSPLRSGASSLFVDTSFALRGAPCGDDPWLEAAERDYHHQESPQAGVPDRPESRLNQGVVRVREETSQRARRRSLGLVERHAMVSEILGCLVQIPVEKIRHYRTVEKGPSLPLTPTLPRCVA